MDVRTFKFDSTNKLSQAKRYLEKNYPYLAVLDNPNDLTLAVELRNSTIFDTRIDALMLAYDGIRVSNESDIS